MHVLTSARCILGLQSESHARINARRAVSFRRHTVLTTFPRGGKDLDTALLQARLPYPALHVRMLGSDWSGLFMVHHF